MIIPKSKHSVIKITKLILNLESNHQVTSHDVETVKCIINKLLSDGLSPKQIKDKYSIDYTDFGMFIKKCLGLEIKSRKEAVNNFFKSQGRNQTNQKIIYKTKCKFSFNPNEILVPGYELFIKSGMYHPVKNPFGAVRDHMLSKEYGYIHNIDPSIISHPANCQFITNNENIRKSTNSCISHDELLLRIKTFDLTPIDNKQAICAPKSDQHKKNLSSSIKEYHAKNPFMFITDGNTNKRVSKSDGIPTGWKRGVTRK